MVLLAVAVGIPSESKVAGVVGDLLEDLQAALVSAGGNERSAEPRMGDVFEGVSADEAGATVGLTGARVRQLCRAGLVTHTKVTGAYVVDVDALRQHLAGDAL
jgi:hypothetical protein